MCQDNIQAQQRLAGSVNIGFCVTQSVGSCEGIKEQYWAERSLSLVLL